MQVLSDIGAASSSHTHTQYVPYTGATTNVNLGSWQLIASQLKTANITINTNEINSSSGLYLQYNTGNVVNIGSSGTPASAFTVYAPTTINNDLNINSNDLYLNNSGFHISHNVHGDDTYIIF